MAIEVDDDVKKMIIDAKQDFRICTACLGPALVPAKVKPSKDSDIKIPIGGYTLYVSKVQASSIKRITMDMLYDEDEIDSCPTFYNYSAHKYNGQ